MVREETVEVVKDWNVKKDILITEPEKIRIMNVKHFVADVPEHKYVKHIMFIYNDGSVKAYNANAMRRRIEVLTSMVEEKK